MNLTGEGETKMGSLSRGLLPSARLEGAGHKESVLYDVGFVIPKSGS
jgi:hypothetical protein